MSEDTCSTLKNYFAPLSRPDTCTLVTITCMVRPESWAGLAGGSPFWADIGRPGSNLWFIAERRQAERDVESFCRWGKQVGLDRRGVLRVAHATPSGVQLLASRAS
jgi:hypothetical protein